MAEEFVLEPGAGAMACIAATRATGGSQNRSLFIEYYDLLLGSGAASAGDALWAAKLLVPGVYVNSRRYAFFGDCSQPFRRPPTTGAFLSLDSSTVIRGSQNHVTASFPGPATAVVRVVESAAWTVYNCIGGGNQITWLRYGSDAFRGIFPAPSGELDFTFFCPVQADTGAYGRASAPALTPDGPVVAYQEWVPVVDSGGYPPDSTGPSIDMWIVGHAGEEDPVTGGDPVMRARLSDPSGIAVFGGSAGRALLVSLDSQGFDISADFAYLPGSTTTGEVEFDPPDLFQGPHTLILAAWDGMGNTSRDTLSFEVSGQGGPLVTELVVYPNPAEGQRCFSFRTSEPGTASIGIFTVAGRQVWSTSRTFQEGYCQVLWDGLDSDGDPPASGPYIYVLEFATPGGAGQTSSGMLAVIRDGGS
jgi:hypothetical protein